MNAEVIGLKGNAVPNMISALIAAAADTLKTIVRKAARSKWRLLLTIAVEMLLAVLAMKLVALLGAAFDISFLRDTGTNGTPWAPLGGLSAGSRSGSRRGAPKNGPPGPPPWRKGPFPGPPNPDGSPVVTAVAPTA